ncbi:DUF397 domain-containing protein [Fodinicola feengrottensis]|uniref:DUF397 domain-containing protein n=1 Tax=Fodinicola feengrottensis TaxID=435914 RepID=A0ABN2H8E2_9ACTN|nr:DUF397 domain-containing protein [Fodinicola feengrottensis]
MTLIVSWRKSSRSTGQSECVEVGSWRKSTRSGGQAECVEVGVAALTVGVRDTKNVAGPALFFSSAAWQAFVSQTKR